MEDVRSIESDSHLFVYLMPYW